MENYFAELNKIDVSDKVEKKGKLSYLSWAWAWGELKKKHPDAQYKIYENEKGWNYFTDGRTCWVKTGVIVLDIEHIEYLPIMDNYNHSVALDKVDSMAVNKAIQRSLTKAVARHGLGLYIYAGEDLPESELIKRNNELNIVMGKSKKYTFEQAVDGANKKYGKGLEELTEEEYAEYLKCWNTAINKELSGNGE